MTLTIQFPSTSEHFDNRITCYCLYAYCLLSYCCFDFDKEIYLGLNMDCQMWFETFRFCSNVSSKCRKCHFREPNFKIEICRHFGLTFLGRQISVSLPSWTEASTPLVTCEGYHTSGWRMRITITATDHSVLPIQKLIPDNSGQSDELWCFHQAVG